MLSLHKTYTETDCTNEQMREGKSKRKGKERLGRIKHVFLLDTMALQGAKLV